MSAKKQSRLGEIAEDVTIDEVQELCRDLGGDFALELRGESVYLYSVCGKGAP